ncbi:hypothetical protein L3Y34_006952 [Caenorhabditis briggsae]|uniref:Uncharacterized protein n=1 Tax=Caenorhabditis briggsae TaxID=6238 RepID=A0AAE8ZVI5_CAEBR|nr:hypothetical protein L3Y34_006952 [Caenorhabditis briggsae]
MVHALWFSRYICLLCMSYGIMDVCEFFFYGDYERKSYVHDSFKGLYHEDSLNMTMVVALYWEGSNDAVVRSWIGVVIVTTSTVYSMLLYFVLGHKIMKKLKVQSSLSEKTINLQRQLFNALTIQTVIPICVSLMPCLAVWFGPVFLLDFRWVYLSAVIAVSIFPSIDPIALIFFLPALRKRVLITRILVTHVNSHLN